MTPDRTVVVEDPDKVVVIDHIGALPYRLTAITDPKTEQLTIKVQVTAKEDQYFWPEHHLTVSLVKASEFEASIEKDPFSL